MQLPNTTNPWRLLGAVLFVCAIIAMAVFGRQWWPQVEELVSNSGSGGFLIFMGFFVVLTMFCFPVSILGFTAGALYGPWFGLLLIYPSGLLSGILMFYLGRGLLRGFVQNLVRKNQRMQAIENMASDHALRLNILTRLSPFNFGIASYALAIGKSSLKSYVLGILVILPSMAAQVWVGALAGKAGSGGEGAGMNDRMELLVLAFGVLFFLILTWQVGKMIRQAMLPNEKE